MSFVDQPYHKNNWSALSSPCIQIGIGKSEIQIKAANYVSMATLKCFLNKAIRGSFVFNFPGFTPFQIAMTPSLNGSHGSRVDNVSEKSASQIYL